MREYWIYAASSRSWGLPSRGRLEEELIGLLMVQVRPFGHLDLMTRFAVLVQQAIDD